VEAGGQVGIQPLLQATQPQFLQTPDLCGGEGYVGEVFEGFAAKQRQRVAKVVPGSLCITRRTRRPGVVEQSLETLEIEFPGFHAEPISGRLRHQPGAVSIVEEDAAKARDVGLQGWARAGRGRSSPQPFDQLVAGYDSVAGQQEHGEGRALLWTTQRQDAALVENPEWAEYQELQDAPFCRAGRKSLVPPGISYTSSSLQGLCKVNARREEHILPDGSTRTLEPREDRMTKQPRQSAIARRWIMVAAASVALAACGGSDGTEQRASEPQTATTEKPSGSSDPLEGEWRTEFTCRESVDAIQRRLSPRQIHQQVGTWKAFLEVWEAKPTRKDPCHQASVTTALLARFADGNLSLCDAETLQCDVSATYELVGKHSIKVDDQEGNLCESNCPVRWEFETTGDELRLHVSPDAFVIGAWEASPWIRQN
jgi:hypothetical protein